MAGFTVNGINYIKENGKCYKIENGKKQEIQPSVFNEALKKSQNSTKNEPKMFSVNGSKSGWYYLKYPNGKIVYKDNNHKTRQKEEFMKHENAFMNEDGNILPYNKKTKLKAALKGIGNFFVDMVKSEQPVPKKDKNGNVVKDSHGNIVYEKNANGTPKTERKWDAGRIATTVVVGAAIGAACVFAAPVAAALGASAAAAAAIGTAVQVGIGTAFVASGAKKMYDANKENQRTDITNEQKIKNWETKGAGFIESTLGAFMFKSGFKSYAKSKSIAPKVQKSVEVKNKASFAQNGELGLLTNLKNRFAAAKEGAKMYRNKAAQQEDNAQPTEKLSDSRPKNADDALENHMYTNAIKRSNDKGQLKTELKKNKNLTEEETTAIKERLNELETQEKVIKGVEELLDAKNFDVSSAEGGIAKITDPVIKARLQARLDVRQLDMGDQTAVNNYYNQNFDNAVALDELASAIERTNKIKPEQKATQLRDIYQRQNALEPEVYPDVEAEITAREQKAAKKQSGTDSSNPSADNKPESSMGWFGKTMRWFRTEVRKIKDDEGNLDHTEYIDRRTGKIYKVDYGELGTYEYKYDADGNRTLSVFRDAKGGYEGHTEFRKSEDGKIEYTIDRDVNDNITSINQKSESANFELNYDSNGKLTDINGREVKYNLDGTAYYEHDLIGADGTVQIQKIAVEQKYLDLPQQFTDVPYVDKGNGSSFLSSLATRAKGMFKAREKLTKKELAPDLDGDIAVQYRNADGKLVKTEWLDEKRVKFQTHYFDENGRCVKIDFGMGSTRKYYYDKNGKKVRGVESGLWGLLKQKYDYLYEDASSPRQITKEIARNKHNKILSIKDNTGSVQVEYFYDKKGNLTKIVQGKGDNAVTTDVKFKDGKAYNTKDGKPVEDAYINRAKECWDDANNYKPEIDETKASKADTDESKKKLVTSNKVKAAAAGGAYASVTKADSYEMAEALMQTQADEAGALNDVDSAEEEPETAEEPSNAEEQQQTEETQGTEEQQQSEGEQAAGKGQNTGTDEQGAEEQQSVDKGQKTEENQASEEEQAADEGQKTGTEEQGAGEQQSVDKGQKTEENQASEEEQVAGGGQSTAEKTQGTAEQEASQKAAARSSDVSQSSRASKPGKPSGSRPNGAGSSETATRNRDKTVNVEDDSVAEDANENARELSPAEKFSITQKVQEAKTEEEIVEALRTLRKTGVFKGRKNLRRLLKNKRRYLKAQENDNAKKMEKYQKRIDKYEDKVEDFQKQADANFVEKYNKKHKGESIF